MCVYVGCVFVCVCAMRVCFVSCVSDVYVSVGVDQCFPGMCVLENHCDCFCVYLCVLGV